MKIILVKSEVYELPYEEMRENIQAVEDEIKEMVIRWEKENGAEVMSIAMAGTVGRWNGNGIGGKHVELGNILESSNYDDLKVYFNSEGELEFRFIHHDGSHYMNLYMITEDRMAKYKLDEDGDFWDAADYQRVHQHLPALKDDGEFNPGWELEEEEK